LLPTLQAFLIFNLTSIEGYFIAFDASIYRTLTEKRIHYSCFISMSIFKNRLRILLYGRSNVAYRSENLIKLLLDDGYNISWINPSFYGQEVDKPNFLAKVAYKLVSKFILVTETVCKAALADVIYLLPMNSYFISRILLMASLFKKKLIAEPYISLYDTIVRDKKEASESSRICRILKRRDRRVLTEPDYIIHISNYEIGYWEKILNITVNRDKVFIAPLFNEANQASEVLKRSFMQDGILRICWWGGAFPLHGLDNILQAMRLLKKKDIIFTCNLFGAENKFFYIYDKLIRSDRQLNQFISIRKDLKFSDHSLPGYLVNNCDLALGIFGNTEKALAGTPNKVVEALSMRIPTLTMNSPLIEEFFDSDVDLWTCDPSPEAIAEAITAIVNGRAYPVNWEQTRQKVLTTFSLECYRQVVKKVLRIVESDLVKNKESS
jgi:glycosyltransferase involved in cell wall biosynthesis